VGFVRGRKVLDLQFPITYDSSGDNPNIARVTGTAPCAYPRRRR
jgi:hypothetical protein